MILYDLEVYTVNTEDHKIMMQKSKTKLSYAIYDKAHKKLVYTKLLHQISSSNNVM